MYGGRNTSSDRQVITLKILVDKTRNRVIFAESDFEFIDSLLSFLTLPLGKVVRLLSSESAAIGSVTRIYGSVSSLESRNLRNDQYKDLLLDPKNASESECNRLKLHACSLGRGIWHTREEDGGVFLKGGAARFMITDDLQVIPGSTAACISLFRKLGIKDGNEVERTMISAEGRLGGDYTHHLVSPASSDFNNSGEVGSREASGSGGGLSRLCTRQSLVLDPEQCKQNTKNKQRPRSESGCSLSPFFTFPTHVHLSFIIIIIIIFFTTFSCCFID